MMKWGGGTYVCGGELNDGSCRVLFCVRLFRITQLLGLSSSQQHTLMRLLSGSIPEALYPLNSQ